MKPTHVLIVIRTAIGFLLIKRFALSCLLEAHPFSPIELVGSVILTS